MAVVHPEEVNSVGLRFSPPEAGAAMKGRALAMTTIADATRSAGGRGEFTCADERNGLAGAMRVSTSELLYGARSDNIRPEMRVTMTGH
jgi:hypothetical protein